MFNWFFRKKDVEVIKEETKKSFDSVKKDINSVGEWIKHLNSEKDFQKKEINDIKNILSSVKEDLKELRNIVSSEENLQINKMFKTEKRLSKKQTAVYPVQTAVQTAVQTPNFNQFSITERAIIGILLNTDLKLSYNDLAAMLGKESSTIRGQINTLKQKSEGLIQEIIEKNSKKRVYIPEKIKETIFKSLKVGVKKAKNNEKI